MKVLSTSKPKARKQYTCEFCYGKIEKNEVYSSQVCVYDTIYIFRTHLACDKIANKLQMYEDVDEELFGEDFRDFIREEFRSIWIAKDTNHFESKEFIIPSFQDQLKFVISNHIN